MPWRDYADIQYYRAFYFEQGFERQLHHDGLWHRSAR